MISATDRNKAVYISELFNRVFGVDLPMYFVWGKQERYPLTYFPDIQFVDPDESEVLSGFGTPVVGSFTLKGGTYLKHAKSGKVEKQLMEDFIMPYATLVDFEQSENSTETKVIGTTGNITEVYGLDNWRISIRGFCITDQSRPKHKTAQEQLDELLKWRKIGASIEVEGRMFLNRDINNIKIKNFRNRAIQGKPNVISFEIDAVSDEAIELIDVL